MYWTFVRCTVYPKWVGEFEYSSASVYTLNSDKYVLKVALWLIAIGSKGFASWPTGLSSCRYKIQWSYYTAAGQKVDHVQQWRNHCKETKDQLFLSPSHQLIKSINCLSRYHLTVLFVILVLPVSRIRYIYLHTIHGKVLEWRLMNGASWRADIPVNKGTYRNSKSDYIVDIF